MRPLKDQKTRPKAIFYKNLLCHKLQGVHMLFYGQNKSLSEADF